MTARDHHAPREWRARRVDLDVADAGAVPRGRDVAPRNRRRVDGSGTEVDRAGAPRGRDSLDHAVAAHRTSPSTVLEHRPRSAARHSPGGLEGERETVGGGESADEVCGEAVRRNDVEADA